MHVINIVVSQMNGYLKYNTSVCNLRYFPSSAAFCLHRLYVRMQVIDQTHPQGDSVPILFVSA